MLGFVQKSTYTSAQLLRNRVLILVPTVAVVAVSMVGVVTSRYGFGQALALWTLVCFFSGGLWWATATKAAGPVGVDPGTTDYVKKMAHPWKSRR